MDGFRVGNGIVHVPMSCFAIVHLQRRYHIVQQEREEEEEEEGRLSIESVRKESLNIDGSSVQVFGMWDVRVLKV